MVAVLALLTLLPLGVLGFVAVSLAQDAVEREVREKVEATAVLEARAVALRMRAITDLAAVDATQRSLVEAVAPPGSTPPDTGQLEGMLAGYASADPGFVSAGLADPTGRLLAVWPSTPEILGEDFSFRDWYRGAVETDGPYLAEAVEGAATGRPLVVTASAPVRIDAGSPVVGYLALGYDLGAIRRFVGELEREHDLSITVTDQRGTVTATPDQPEGLVSIAGDERVERALAGETGTVTVDGEDGALLSSFAPVQGIGWTVHAEVSRSEALAPITHLRNVVIAVSSGIAVMVVIVASLLGRTWAQRARAQEEATTAASYARSLIEASVDPMLAVDAEGTITDVNGAASDLLRADRRELVGSSFSTWFADRDLVTAGHQHALAEGRTTDLALSVLPAPDDTREVMLNESLYRTGGPTAGAIATLRDVTAWRAAEDELAARARDLEVANVELARSNADLEQFAYVASHDLSEPLRAISGPISLVAHRYRGQLDEDADQFIDFAVDGCARMQAMITDLLTYSRVGRLEAEMEPVDCRRVVDAVITALGPSIAEACATVDVGDLPVVIAERSQLTLVFQNLISNALKFVRPGVAPHVEVAAERRAREVRFIVTDNGIGIEPRHRELVFGMFKRLHGREEYGGTGIGLALAKKIVERHGGRIGIDDPPTGTGSQFWFTIPVERGEGA